MEWNESEIISACQKQDKQAQMALFQKFHEKFLGICIRYLYDQQTAEEVLMDAFMRIFEKIEQYQKGSFEGWMKTIVIHKSIDYYRKHKKDPLISDFEKESYWISEKSNGHHLEAEELLQMLNTLPTGYRMVFNLFAIEGYKHQEIAKKLGISESTSKSQYHKARMKLQEELKKGGYHG